MRQQGRRRLRDGRDVPVHDNDGLRKICGCPRRAWAKCEHPWHFAFSWKGRAYRFSLDRHTGRRIEGKTEAAAVADQLRGHIRSGTFGAPDAPTPKPAAASNAGSLSFEKFAEIFIERYTKVREKISWEDDVAMLRRIMAFPVTWPGARRLGEKPLSAITEDDIESVIRQVSATRSATTVNHYVQMVRALCRWAVKRGYREQSFLPTESDVIRRRKVARRNRRLEPGEEEKLLSSAGPHLQRLIIAALETCCRQGELLSLQWRDVSLGRREIALRAAKTKTATDRIIPISDRLRAVLEHVRLDPNDEPQAPTAFVFGDELGGRIKCVRRAWQTAVLKAHDHQPAWHWTKGRTKKGVGKLSKTSQAQYHAIDLHFHDLRHEAGSRLLEAGWPLHEVQQMLGHTSLEQTSTYLNATLRGMHRSMRAFDRARSEMQPTEPSSEDARTESGEPCKNLASEPEIAHRPPCNDAPPSADKSLIH